MRRRNLTNCINNLSCKRCLHCPSSPWKTHSPPLCSSRLSFIYQLFSPSSFPIVLPLKTSISGVAVGRACRCSLCHRRCCFNLRGLLWAACGHTGLDLGGLLRSNQTTPMWPPPPLPTLTLSSEPHFPPSGVDWYSSSIHEEEADNV